MNIYSCQEAFAAADKTTQAMRKALRQWRGLYFQQQATSQSDPCQRIAYTVVNKITRAVFGEYSTQWDDPVGSRWLRGLEDCRREAVQLALMSGECYLKPCPNEAGFSYTLIPRGNLLVFGRDSRGMPTDVGTVEQTVHGRLYYTLLERRKAEGGLLTIENALYRSYDPQNLGTPASLKEHPAYRHLPEKWQYPIDSIGLVRMKTPMVNCVDGSADGVAVFAPAVQLIQAIDRNEAQLNGEFERGESRILLSRDLLDKDKNLSEHLFVGLDEDPEQVGMTIFSPQLREQSFLARKQEYLRNVESVLGLKRGMLSDANLEERTATEIASSGAEYALTVMDFQEMWEDAVRQTMDLCRQLAAVYGLPGCGEVDIAFDWGNGVLYDEEKVWADYLTMVDKGLLRPEIALGWRFGRKTDEEGQLAEIRKKFMPE